LIAGKHFWRAVGTKSFRAGNFWGFIAGTVPVTGKVNLDPWLIGTGLTYKF
jgi:outer membrane protein